MNDDIEVHREVPDSLQRLVRFVTRGFYGIEYGLTVDVLVRNPCVKEEDIQELLKFDKKQLRVVLQQLKNDKFLKSRLHVETQLHHMHKRIETMERDETNRPSFKCPKCQNTYSDLEVNQLIGPSFDQLNCTFCGTEVVEDQAAAAAQDGRTLQAKFNEQMEPVYNLLKEVENMSLSEDVLEPKPTDIPHLHPGGTRVNKPKAKTDDKWSTAKSGMIIHQEQDVVVDLGEENKEELQAKEMPIWMRESTVTGASSLPSVASAPELRSYNELDSSKPINDEVMQTLLVQERSSKPPAPSFSHRHHQEAAEESDEFEDVEEDEMVLVAGKPYTYEEVTHKGSELINQMTAQEKEHYIRIGQRLYEDMDD